MRSTAPGSARASAAGGAAPAAPARPRIAYVMSRFPFLPETFILREMIALEALGWPIELYPLIVEHPPVVHEAARPWVARMHDLPVFAPRYLAACAAMLARRPVRFATTLARVALENLPSPNLLARGLLLFPKAVYLAAEMRAAGVAHVHAHYATHPALAAWVIGRLAGISYSVTVHAHDIFVRRAMLPTKMRDALFIAAISEYNRELVVRLCGEEVREKVHVVHCGIEPEACPLPAAPRRPGERFEILSVGSLQPYKGQRHLVAACAILKTRGLAFRCRIVGGGELHGDLSRRVREAGLEAEVELLGALPQERVAGLLPTAHCYCQPSVVTPAGKMEGIPVSIMEAMACGLPVVATAISGIPELVRHGESGLLVPPEDETALAAALAAVAADPGRAFAMGRRGRSLVEAGFTLRDNVGKLSALLADRVRPPRGADGAAR